MKPTKVKHKIVKRRINKEARELKKFTANQLLDVLHNYPNMHGIGKTSLQITVNRLCNFLRINPCVKYIPNKNNKKLAGMWEWIEGEEK